jgi:midasin
VEQAKKGFAFAFVEGTLTQALKRGDWVLLDEINLASAETLECLNGLLDSEVGAIATYADIP